MAPCGLCGRTTTPSAASVAGAAGLGLPAHSLPPLPPRAQVGDPVTPSHGVPGVYLCIFLFSRLTLNIRLLRPPCASAEGIAICVMETMCMLSMLRDLGCSESEQMEAEEQAASTHSVQYVPPVLFAVLVFAKRKVHLGPLTSSWRF